MEAAVCVLEARGDAETVDEITELLVIGGLLDILEETVPVFD